MLRPRGIDNTVIVDVFNTMTQAQVDLQNQLEQAASDLITRPLLNDSPVLYIDTSERIPTTSLEQMEQEKLNMIHRKFQFYLMILIIHTQLHLLRKNDMKE